MASVPLKNLQPHEVAELACTYAALILHDEEIDINAKKIEQLINAAGVHVDAFWPKLFAKALDGRSVADFFHVSGGDDAGAHHDTHTAAPAGKDKEPAKKDDKKKEEPKKVEKVVEKPPEDDFDGGMGDLFG